MALSFPKTSLPVRIGAGLGAAALERLARAAGIARRTRPGAALEGRCVVAGPSCRETLEALRAQSATWREAEGKLARIVPQAPWLLQDLFCLLYEPGAPLNPEVDPVFHWNFRVVAGLLADPDFRRLQARTAGDGVEASLAALQLAEEATSEALLTAAQRKQLRRAWQGRALLPLLPLPFGTPSGEADMLIPLARAVRQTAARLEAHEALRSAWGIHPGSCSYHQLDDVARLLAAVRALPGFQELTEAVERFRLALGRRRGVARRRPGPVGRARVAGYTLGGDLGHAAPEEVVKLTDRRLEGLFYEAYEHRRLLQHAYVGHGQRHRGPLVCCMDVSRSMNAPAALGWERFLWAKAIGLTLLDVARRADRPFLGVCFSSETELAAFPMPAGADRDPGIAVAMAGCDFNGGTRFEGPLLRALEFMEAQGAREGHVVFITDGEAPLPAPFRDRFRREKARLGAELLTVFIDGGHDGLASLSDRVFHVRSEQAASWERALLAVADRVEGGRNP